MKHYVKRLSAEVEKLNLTVENLEQPSEYPNRYYPNKRYEPNFYLEIPALADGWASFIQDQTFRSGTSARLNFVNRLGAGSHTWYGVYVDFRADSTAYAFSAGDDAYLYLFELRHHLNFDFANVTYSIDPEYKAIHWPTVDWQDYATADVINQAVIASYELMEFGSGITKTCQSIDLYLDASGVTATGDCIQR